MHTISAFESALDDVEHEVVVTLPADQVILWRCQCERHNFAVPHTVVPGGETRWHSVKNALDTLGDSTGLDVIAVHDGVRPLASTRLIRRCLDTARSEGSAIPVIALNDSVRQVDDQGTSRALDRSSLRAVQTPQVFDAHLLLDSYRQPFEPTFTDDASVVERAGHHVTLVEGDPVNLKITRPMDLALAEYLLRNA